MCAPFQGIAFHSRKNSCFLSSLSLPPSLALLSFHRRHISKCFFSKNHSHFPVSEFYFSFFLQSSPAGQTNREKAIAAIKEKVNCSHCFSSSLRDKAKILYSILCFETIFFIRTHRELFCYIYHVRFCADWAVQI